MRLFSYCIPIDDGAAPNPFWGKCTLAICKPVIRRKAEIGDWIAGLGSKNTSGTDYSGKLVYAMKVTDKMSMQKYDFYCRHFLPDKIPDIRNGDYRRRVGDCIYDFETDMVGRLRDSVHTSDNRERDLGGVYALLSDHFYYFGNNAVVVPDEFSVIIKQGHGHKSKSNEPIKSDFIDWLENTFEKTQLYGEPQVEFKAEMSSITCGKVRLKAAEEDEGLPDVDNELPLNHWNYFLALESDLKRISRYIEIHPGNYKTFSISLAQLLLATCSEIDIVLREMCIMLSEKMPEKIDQYFEIIEKRSEGFFKKQVLIPVYKLSLEPWAGWTKGKSPEWWTAYNKIKHHRNLHYEKANLQNCIYALGALYIAIYEMIRVHNGKTEAEFASLLIYKHLQPRQELFALEGENKWRDIAERKSSLF